MGRVAGQKVVVVCKPLTSLAFNNQGVDRALAEGICERLKHNVKKIEVIDPDKVAGLCDKTGMEDCLEIGKALKAEKVVGVNIASFGVLEGQTLFLGRSTVSIRVYDVATKHVDWRKAMPEVKYPTIGPKPAQDVPEMEFRNQFVDVLAEQIARCFYPHDENADYAAAAP